MRLAPLAFAAFVLLTGCTPAHSHTTAAPSPTGTPLFASEDEALKAASDAYAAYLKVGDEILNDGGANPDRIRAVATGTALEGVLAGAKHFESAGYRSIGRSVAKSTELQRYSTFSSDGVNVVTIYVCLDVAGAEVVDDNNISVVSPGRPDLQPLEITLDQRLPLDGSLLVASQDAWTGQGVCE